MQSSTSNANKTLYLVLTPLNTYGLFAIVKLTWIPRSATVQVDKFIPNQYSLAISYDHVVNQPINAATTTIACNDFHKTEQ